MFDTKYSRRDFLKFTGVTGAGLLLSHFFPGFAHAAMSGEAVYTNAGITLFQDLYRAADPKKNVLFAPGAAHGALLQLSIGATGNSANAVNKLYGGNVQEAAAAITKIFSDILPPKGSKAQARMNAEMWISDKLKTTPKYLNNYEHAFGGKPVTGVDFSSPKTIDLINAWIKTNTNGKIDKLYEKIAAETGLVTVGSMYFKAPWVDKFNPELTNLQGEFNTGGKIIKVPMMRMPKAKAAYLETEAYTYAAIPFMDGYEFFAIVPKTSLDKTVENLPGIFREIQTNAKREIVNLSMPRLELSDKSNVTQALRKGILGPLFSPASAADFNAIALGSGAITEARQGVGLVVNEEGGEAYGAFGTMTTRGISHDPIVEVNKPSFVGINCTRNGARVPLIYVALVNPAPR